MSTGCQKDRQRDRQTDRQKDRQKNLAPSAKYIQVSETNIQEISEPNHLLSRSSDGSGGVVKEKRQSFIFWSSDTVHNCSSDLLINVQKHFYTK